MKKFIVTEICQKFYSELMGHDIVEFRVRPYSGKKITCGRIVCKNGISKDDINIGTVYTLSYIDGYKIVK